MQLRDPQKITIIFSSITIITILTNFTKSIYFVLKGTG